MDLMTRRRALSCKKDSSGGDIPDIYQKVNYIQSDGESCIQTDVIPSNTIGFDCVFYTSGPFGAYDYGCIFGGRYSSGNNDFQLTTYRSSIHGGYQGTFRFGNAGSDKNAGIALDTKQKASFRNLTYHAPDGSATSMASYDWTSNVRPIALFLLRNGNTYTQGGDGCRIYQMRFYDGDTLTREYVPCYRKSDGVIGMYEIITGEFLTNANSDGSFTKGSNIN